MNEVEKPIHTPGKGVRRTLHGCCHLRNWKETTGYPKGNWAEGVSGLTMGVSSPDVLRHDRHFGVFVSAVTVSKDIQVRWLSGQLSGVRAVQNGIIEPSGQCASCSVLLVERSQPKG